MGKHLSFKVQDIAPLPPIRLTMLRYATNLKEIALIMLNSNFHDTTPHCNYITNMFTYAQSVEGGNIC